MQCSMELHNVVHQDKNNCFVFCIESWDLTKYILIHLLSIEMKKSEWWIKTRKFNCDFGRVKAISSAKSRLFTKLCMVKQSLYNNILTGYIISKKSSVCQRKLNEWGRSVFWHTKMVLKFDTKDGLSRRLKVIILFDKNFFPTHTQNLPHLTKRHFSVLTGTKVLFLLFYYQN